ncbi:MAG: DUF2069 domain-containing protein [Steroidobacteraceae bacterium]
MSAPVLRARRGVLLTHGLLLATLIAWQLSMRPSLAGLGIAFLLSIPLLAPWSGLLRAHRFTHVWATMCVMPYLVVGVMEAIADPAHRAWASACVAFALAFFAALILYLRVTRPQQI